MADNLSISITADTASLRAQLAQAQAEVRAYGAEVRKLANDLRSAGACGCRGTLTPRAGNSSERARNAGTSS